jgi:hypothetical protein
MNDKAIAPALHPICSIRPFLNKKDNSLAWKSIPSPKTWDHSHTFLSCFCRDRSVIQFSHSHKIVIFLSYYIHCYVFQLVCQYDDIPLAFLIYCKRTFFPMCRMSGNVNTLVYIYLAVCTSVFIPQGRNTLVYFCRGIPTPVRLKWFSL